MSARRRPWAGRKLHFVGVGGAGLSGYARAAHALGATVSGSDKAESQALLRLRADGVLDAQIGHEATHVPAGADVELVYSSAVDASNPERLEARRRGLTERSRGQLLGELSALRRTIAVAGTHGKTTTSAMLVQALRAADLDPGWLIGAPLQDGLPNAHWSEAPLLVIEADESDRSMLDLDVEIAVLTNAELDHHTQFRSLHELRAAFAQFLAGAKTAVVCDEQELRALCPPAAKVYHAEQVSLTRGGSSFCWRGRAVELAVPGAHNASNAAGALEAARLAGADEATAVAGIAQFRGAGRRFERLGFTAAGALVIDDYAHHPTEVAATVAAARSLQPASLVAVFQPHLYTRTALLARKFGAALALADTIAVLDVYPARERSEDHPGVSGLLVAKAAADAAPGRRVLWLPRLLEAQRTLAQILAPDDLCLVMGAGDVSTLAHGLVANG